MQFFSHITQIKTCDSLKLECDSKIDINISNKIKKY